MTLRLSTDDIARLNAAQTLLLSPLDAADDRSWGAAVCEAMRALVGAQHVNLFSTGAEPELWYTTAAPACTRDFLSHYAGCDPVSRRVVERGIECASTWEVVGRREFLASEFYNDFVRPHSLYEAMGIRIPSAPGRHLWLTLQHDTALPESEVQRKVELMRLTLPAFKAGARLAAAHVPRPQSLAAVLDALPHALQLATVRGEILYENAALERLLAGAAGGEILRGVLREVLWALGPSGGRTDGGGREMALRGAFREVEAGGMRYRLSGGVMAEGPLGPEPVLLVQLERVGSPAATFAELQDRFGLTPREGEVALLLAERRTNREVAEALGISPHTAERHTERVLGKLSIRSRLQVPDRLAAAFGTRAGGNGPAGHEG